MVIEEPCRVSGLAADPTVRVPVEDWMLPVVIVLLKVLLPENMLLLFWRATLVLSLESLTVPDAKLEALRLVTLLPFMTGK